MLKSLEIFGLRGFASTQTLSLALPNGSLGSGLTILVGANNAGKSTAIEALSAISLNRCPSFTQGRRNQMAGDSISIKAIGVNGKSIVLKSIRPGTSETEYIREEGYPNLVKKLFVLPSRRVFNPYFGGSDGVNRSSYLGNADLPAIRSNPSDRFAQRLFTIEKNREAFNAILEKIITPVPDWSIDQTDTGQYFLKFRKGDSTHSSEGLGEGLVSLLYIIDALYDSKEEDIIAIDEPELSLHPALQRKLSSLLIEYAATRQIIISTHSPYFARLDALPHGATVARAHVVEHESKISQMSPDTAQALFRLMQNQNNPHILGLNAQEIFFIDDKVILVEGQEDVIFFERVQNEVGCLKGSFFGWGVGGADNMETIATLLTELGFSKVVGILDGNRAELVSKLSTKFPSYHFFSIPAEDVRTKKATTARPTVSGLLDEDNKHIRPEHVEHTKLLFGKANHYLLN